MVMVLHHTEVVLPKSPGAAEGSRLTDDCEDAVGLRRPEGVSDLTDVGATVLSAQVTDGQPCDALSPAAVSREGPAIFEPADGRDGVARGSTGQLHGMAGPHFLGVEAIQDCGDGLCRVCKKRGSVTEAVLGGGNRNEAREARPPDGSPFPMLTESRFQSGSISQGVHVSSMCVSRPG